MKILIVDDEANARYGMAKAIKGDDRTIIEADNGRRALEIIDRESPNLVFLDLQMPELDGHGVLTELQRKSSGHEMEIIVVTANDSIANAIDCIRNGASDFLAKPYDVEHVRAIVNRSEKRVRLEHRVHELSTRASTDANLGALVGNCSAMRKLFQQIPKAAKSHLAVLIRGESGTGKELVAQELHHQSARTHGPFIAVNTAAIPDTLVESELFGHVKGAFTGADRPRDGVFRKADGGTLFLDEIGDMPSGIQTRLLRVLQEGIVQPVGSEDGIKVDVRIISATHQDLEEQIQNKLFRQDLYFRLRGIELHLPSLRHRGDDVLILAKRFLGHRHELSKDAIAALINHGWPGNVRELKQRIESALAMADDERISAMDLGLQTANQPSESATFESYLDLPLTDAKNRLVEDFERIAIARALEMESGNISAAARRLGIHRQNLQQKIRDLEL
jgi:DNA-binding NtrC family response regulator